MMNGMRTIIDRFLSTVLRIVCGLNIWNREVRVTVHEVPKAVLEEHHRLVRYPLSVTIPHLGFDASPSLFRLAWNEGGHIARLYDKSAY